MNSSLEGPARANDHADQVRVREYRFDRGQNRSNDDHVRDPRPEAHLAGDLADEPSTSFQISVPLGGAERPGGRSGRSGPQVEGQAFAG